ncbi:hypothetical protein H5410_031531 [Solanum commersonii]|uniref:Transposase-associated domain-containing protein n=1 Tax=Solanum commersonii TaxID=4109 RepID=A0A9J5YIM4_SOLCO|nr:hypothetical protein H5410_031531 [Solanum commersonii]
MVHLYRNGFKPRYFVWIDHGESDGLDGMFYNSMNVDVYNMVAPHGQIRVEHDRAHEMINDAFGVQDVSCRRNRPNRNDEGDIDPLFPPISIFNQNGRGSKKRGKRDFTDMEMQSVVTHPQHILEEVSNDEILNVEEEISENEKNESFDDEEWDDNENETTEEEEWENDGIETSGDSDKHREHLGDLFLLRQSASAMILIYFLPFDTTNPRHCLHVAMGTYLYMLFIEHDPYQHVLYLPQSDAMAGTPLLTQCFVHHDVSPSSTTTLSATPNDMIPALASG